MGILKRLALDLLDRKGLVELIEVAAMKYLDKIKTLHRNPYEDFGYELIFEEYPKPIEGARRLNHVRLECNAKNVVLSSEMYEIVTFVDIAYYIINYQQFKNSLIRAGMDKEAIYDVLNSLTKPHLEFIPLDDYSILELKHTLIYMHSSIYEDSFYRDEMILTNNNTHRWNYVDKKRRGVKPHKT